MLTHKQLVISNPTLAVYKWKQATDCTSIGLWLFHWHKNISACKIILQCSDILTPYFRPYFISRTNLWWKIRGTSCWVAKDDLSGLFYRCCLNPVPLSLYIPLSLYPSLFFSFSKINVWRSMVRLTKWRHSVVIVALIGLWYLSQSA